MCGLAICSVWIVLAPPAFAFEPMPPIMQKLLEVFPEENGRFVDEPFGSTEQMPKEARPLFETFRVVVPTPDDIDKNLARLFSASSHFPIKKITRYDKEPGAPGLPGFRGVWCQTEDESQVGFSIVTINQNRFLIWAKMGYYPAFANDSINPKVRDQYARDVSQYLAGIDFKVPDNEAPQAGGRGLPEWMEIYRRRDVERGLWRTCRDSLEAREWEIVSWGFRGIIGLEPTTAIVETIIEHSTDTLWANALSDQLQQEYRDAYYASYILPIEAFSKSQFDSMRYAQENVYAIDRYGRMRLTLVPPETVMDVPVTLLFPMAAILTHGIFRHQPIEGASRGIPPELKEISVGCSPYFLSVGAGSEVMVPLLDEHVRSIGHFLRAMRDRGIPVKGILISRH